MPNSQSYIAHLDLIQIIKILAFISIENRKTIYLQTEKNHLI